MSHGLLFQIVWVPYIALEVVDVVDPAILEKRHTWVWRSVIALIYFGVIERHQVDRASIQPGMRSGRLGWLLFLTFQFKNFPVHPHPSPYQEFLDWWYELPHRFLSPEALLVNFRAKGMKESMKVARKGHGKQGEEKGSQLKKTDAARPHPSLARVLAPLRRLTNQSTMIARSRLCTSASAPLRRLSGFVNGDRAPQIAHPHGSVKGKNYKG
ncbi:hypothetical protein PIB30_042365 [Stylosanthes scabra]|uniref:Aminotransferase-like plant mobile domain-containing protein n=1 Tax=Stylosanthes scabra TaxID=79078 RepID=A0ABU6UEF5_9FABA|nr:hypothetical protein [Stylosanthes scabra]